MTESLWLAIPQTQHMQSFQSLLTGPRHERSRDAITLAGTYSCKASLDQFDSDAHAGTCVHTHCTLQGVMYTSSHQQ